MGRQVELVMLHGRDVKAKRARDGMLYDEDGEFWPKCSLLITPFENGRKQSDHKRGREFFGRKTKVFEGHVDLPPKSLSGWTEVGEVKTVFYDRAGKYDGPFRHEFNKPRGLWVLLWPFKRGSKQPAILFRRGDSMRVELPEGCIVDDRGIVVP